ALATVLDTAEPQEICLHWSQRTDNILRRAWEMAKLDSEPLAVFALGKLGSMELNLSSDIDLFIVAAEEISPEMQKKTQTFTNSLEKSGTEGFCYRIDFDLRPG